MKWFVLCLVVINVTLLAMIQRSSGTTSGAEAGSVSNRVSESGGCLLLGPFRESEGRNLVKEQQDSRVDLVTQAISLAPRYVVYLGPYQTWSEARRKLNDLKSSGVDSYILTAPNLNNAISLGVFDNVDSARRMQKELRERLGEVKTGTLERTEKLYWLYYPVSTLETSGSWKKSSKSRKIFCKSVDS